MPSSTAYAHTLQAISVCVAADVPVLLKGSPGQGKTAVTAAVAAALGLHHEVVIASIREPSDFSGLPIHDGIPIREGGRVELAPPAFALRANEAPHGALLVFDELSTAPPAVQAALLRLVQERYVGDLRLNDGVRVLAAMNPPEEAADGWDLPAPTANRFCHLDFHLAADAFVTGMTIGWRLPGLPGRPTASTVGTQVAQARAQIAAFIQKRNDLLTVVPKDLAAGSGPWPSPRSWENAARLLGYARAMGLSRDVQLLVVQGTVGPGPAGEALTYIESLDLPDPEDILADPEAFSAPRRGDRVYAAAASVLAAVAEHNTADRWVAFGKVLGVLARGRHADIAVAVARTWAQTQEQGGLRRDGYVPDKTSLEALFPVISSLGVSLREA